MEAIIKGLFKFLLHGIFWTFLLSININQRPIFSYANDFFVQNSLVQAADEKLATLWENVKTKSEAVFRDEGSKEKDTATF